MKTNVQPMNMTWQGRLFICYILCLFQINHADQFNYLFVKENSLIKIPVLPFDCLACQSADEVSLFERNDLFIQ